MDEDLLGHVGHFTWMWNDIFFIEAAEDNYLWSDPNHKGDNTIKKYDGTYEDFLETISMTFGRDKGRHIIGEYCKNAVVIK